MKDNNLYVATLRNNMLYIYNTNGDLISKSFNEDSFDLIGKNNQYIFYDGKGNTYKIKNRLLCPHVTITNKKDSTKNLISNNIFEWLLLKPIPSQLLSIVGIIVLMGGFKRLKEGFEGVEGE